MYNVVFKQKEESLIIFDVFKTSLFGKQKVIGNVFCTVDERGTCVKMTSSVYVGSIPKKKWDGGDLDFKIEEATKYICNTFISECMVSNVKNDIK